MSERKSFSGQRDEIKLYMDKGYQASFGYFAALVAVFAVSKTAYAADVAAAIGVSVVLATALFLLVTNLFYSIILLSCLFAILKRGLFILRMADSSDRDWEVFARDPTKFDVWASRGRIAWNIDNWFMIPVLVVILLVSVGAVYVGIKQGGLYIKLSAFALFALHTIPAWMLISLSALSAECTRQADTPTKLISTPPSE